MTRFKKELIARNVLLEETVPYLPFEHIECSIVHPESASVYYYDNRIGKYWVHYGRHMHVVSVTYEDEDLM